MTRQPDHIYVLVGERGTKVGVSCNVRVRQGKVADGRPASVVRTWHRPDDCREIEWLVKKALRDKRSDYSTEWFALPANVVCRHVNTWIRRLEAGDIPTFDCAYVPKRFKVAVNTVYNNLPRKDTRGTR